MSNAEISAILRLALELPIVIALIFLVLKLEDKRQHSAKLREDANQKIVDSLLGVIDELASRSNPDRLTSAQIKSIEAYLQGKD